MKAAFQTGWLFFGLLALAEGLPAAIVQAGLMQPGFEGSFSSGWEVPRSGGLAGGGGENAVVDAGDGGVVHSGERACRMEVWNAGDAPSVGWTVISQRHAAQGGQKVEAGFWVYYSSTESPLTEGGAFAQIQIEYFADDAGEQQIITHVGMSPPFRMDTHLPDQWHLIDVRGRVPSKARSMRISVRLLGEDLGSGHEAVWVDDVYLRLLDRRSIARSEP